jgi:hypothetical protein
LPAKAESKLIGRHTTSVTEGMHERVANWFAAKSRAVWRDAAEWPLRRAALARVVH